jgi:hypothetical protein
MARGIRSVFAAALKEKRAEEALVGAGRFLSARISALSDF